LALGSIGVSTLHQQHSELKTGHIDNNDELSVSSDKEKEPLSCTDNYDVTAVNKRRSFKGRPRIASAVDSSRLNKHLTAVWGSKRKKSSKRVTAVDVGNADEIITTESIESDRSTQEESNEKKDLEHVEPESMASTVIILKTASRQSEGEFAQWNHHTETQWTAHNDTQWMSGTENIVDIEMEFVDEAMTVVPPPEASKASRDIAERLKARKRRFTDFNNEGSNVAISNVSCELCGEAAPGYAQLVQHVHRQHKDCTFVRNYLDEIKPLAAALSAVSLPCSECGRMFSGQTALSSHKYECHSMARPETKLGVLRRFVKAAAANKTDSSLDKDHGNRLSCKNCNKKFKSANKLQQHEMTHVETNDVIEVVTSPVHGCRHCGKEFHARDNLMKHIKRIHGSQPKNDNNKLKNGKQKKQSESASEAVKGSMKTSKILPRNVATSSDGGTSNDLQEFACNHCKTVFGRMSLLVTHMRYCVKANNVKI